MKAIDEPLATADENVQVGKSTDANKAQTTASAKASGGAADDDTSTRGATSYDFNVCDTEITSENAADITAAINNSNVATGTISYDAATETLTLNNATLNNCDVFIIIDVNGSAGLTIELIGTNTMTFSNRNVCINGNNNTLRFKGSGTLTCTGGSQSYNCIEKFGDIYFGYEGGTFSGSASFINENICEASSTIKCTNIYINGGSVYAENDFFTGSGIYASQIEITNYGKLEAKGNGYAIAVPPTLAYAVKYTASTNFDGSSPTTYNSANISSYKYLKIEPADVGVTFNGTTTGYSTFDDAWAAAIACDTTSSSKATITLCKNISTATATFTNAADYLVLDTNGNTLTLTDTSNTSRFLLTGGSLDVKGSGTVTGKTSENFSIAILSAKSGTLTAA